MGLGSGSWTGWSLSADLASLATVKNPVARVRLPRIRGQPKAVGVLTIRSDPRCCASLRRILTKAFGPRHFPTPVEVRPNWGPGKLEDLPLRFLWASRSLDRRRSAWALPSNPSTPAAALANLVRDRDVIVRAAVAGNENTPQEALKVLAVDPEDSVLLSPPLANPMAPIRFIEAQADRPADWAGARWMERIAGNPSSPEAVLRKIGLQARRGRPRSGRGERQYAPDTLAILAQDDSPNVRNAVERRHS